MVPKTLAAVADGPHARSAQLEKTTPAPGTLASVTPSSSGPLKQPAQSPLKVGNLKMKIVKYSKPAAPDA